ncbi:MULTISPECIES: group II intron reverse transcriptase/maturase [unclassified Streptomyces]|uniref:group II intron reverse transcriptase/maturase n=1 Tax=unclassified Streptomyces TaxID=2593676 RepID=UPI000AA31667|nr:MULTISPECIES: group II intron reverse transcriptase/maturase [unclassified Streptomyces]
MSGSKSFEISKHVVWEAYLRVKANRGAAGVDGESIEQFEADLKGNLYKLWNRLSSGSYFPPPVRMVEIPKPGGRGVRVLGVPTVADRIAQTVVAMVLEPEVEPVFHPDSYGYRPRRSALDALAVCRERCWRKDWVIDIDIRGFFDNLDHDLVLKAVAHHTDQRWILLYVERWLKAPLHQDGGVLVARDRGSPQGSAISPLLANLFMHYAFDAWMAREFPAVAFERYCDDMVVHCRTEAEAHQVRQVIGERLAQCGGLQLHPDKTRIVYCKDGKRRGSYEHTSFTFLGYAFRSRKVRTRSGSYFFSFNPAISDEAAKRIRKQIRAWRLHQRSGSSLADLAREINPIVRGWIGYYGRFYPSELVKSLKRINHYLMRWAMQKYKRLRRRRMRAWTAWGRPHGSTPVCSPTGSLSDLDRLGDGSRVNREVHARF